MKEMAAYYYPTLVVFVDDSEGFLTSVSLELDTNLAYMSFSDPEKALKFIQKTPNQNLAKKAFLKDLEPSDDLPSSYQINMAFEPLWQAVYNAERFNEISVIVVDYSMPGLNGIKLCEKLKNSPVKVIMLTGEADASIAVKAFNEGLIDHFLLKESQHSDNELSQLISELQQQYFVEQTKGLVMNLEAQSLPFSWLEPEFIELLSEINKQYKIVEHYPIQSTGSLLLLQADGTPLWLVIVSDQELKEYYEFAEGIEVPTALLRLLKSGQKIPFFPTMDEYLEAEGSEWNNYLHPAKKLKTKDHCYYYALIKDFELLPLDQRKVVSYRYYLEHLWPPIEN